MRRHTQPKPITTEQLAKLRAHAAALTARHPAAIAQLRRDLATNFDSPAQSVINAAFNRMGADRFTPAGDDLWEMITALENDWDYNRPSRELVNRWACA